MALASITACLITLSLVGVFAIFSVNMEAITANIEESVLISAKVSFEHEDQANLDRILAEIESVNEVSEVTFYTKDEELAYFLEVNATDEDTKMIYDVYTSENNPFHHMYYIEVNEGVYLSDVAGKLSAIVGLQEINYGGDSTIILVNALESIRAGGIIIVAALSFLAITLISNTIKLAISARTNEIFIMRSVGASNAYIRMPFMVEGMIIGFLGGLLPAIAGAVGYYYLYDYLGGVWFSALFVMVEPLPFGYYLTAGILLIGIVVGLFGSLISVTRFLRRKR